MAKKTSTETEKENAPEIVAPVDTATVVTTDQTLVAPVAEAEKTVPVEPVAEVAEIEAKPATIADTTSLIGSVTGAFEDAGKVTAIPLPASTTTLNTPASTGIGCQCTRCKETGGNKDKRGRHHATCPCDKCCESRGETPAPKTAPVASTADNPFAAIQAVGQAAELAVDQAKQFTVMGEMTFDISTGALATIFGPEWRPQNEDERKGVAGAIAEYYRIKGVKDLPPGWMLLAVCLAYSAPRFAHANTRSKLSLAWDWTKVRAKYVLGRFFRRKP